MTALTLPTILGLVGITYIITRSRLTLNIRQKVPVEWVRYFLNCANCVGFWVGFLGYIAFSPELTDILVRSVHSLAVVKTLPYMPMLTAFVHGGLISVLSSLVVNFLELLAFSKDYMVTHINPPQH